MFTATADLVLPGTTTGSFPRPRWFDVSMGPPDRNIQSQTFGTITSTTNDPRIVQLVFKYFF